MRLRIWTADEPARKLPAGRAQRVNPSLTAIFKEELVLTYGLFFRPYFALQKPKPGIPGFVIKKLS
jgi:hypothetical protein